MEKLVGSWKLKMDTGKDQNAFYDALGFSAEMQEPIKKREYCVTYSVNGNKLRSVMKVANDPSLGEQIVESELDEECEYTDFEKGKMMVKISSDGTKFYESYWDNKGFSFTCVREVKGNIMTLLMTKDGVSTCQEWEKC